MSVTELKYKSGRILQIINGEYVIGAGSACKNEIKCPKKIFNGYVIENCMKIPSCINQFCKLYVNIIMKCPMIVFFNADLSRKYTLIEIDNFENIYKTSDIEYINTPETYFFKDSDKYIYKDVYKFTYNFNLYQHIELYCKFNDKDINSIWNLSDPDCFETNIYPISSGYILIYDKINSSYYLGYSRSNYMTKLQKYMPCAKETYFLPECAKTCPDVDVEVKRGNYLLVLNKPPYENNFIYLDYYKFVGIDNFKNKSYNGLANQSTDKSITFYFKEKPNNLYDIVNDYGFNLTDTMINELATKTNARNSNGYARKKDDCNYKVYYPNQPVYFIIYDNIINKYYGVAVNFQNNYGVATELKVYKQC